MVDLFASVGVDRFDVTLTDLQGSFVISSNRSYTRNNAAMVESFNLLLPHIVKIVSSLEDIPMLPDFFKPNCLQRPQAALVCFKNSAEKLSKTLGRLLELVRRYLHQKFTQIRLSTSKFNSYIRSSSSCPVL